MEIEKYMEIVKLLQKEGISENIICRILEEYGKDLRTNAMEEGKNKRTGSYIVSETTEKNDSGSIETSNPSNGITDKQLKALLKISKNPDGEKFLQSKKINSEEDLIKLTKKQAWELMKEYNE